MTSYCQKTIGSRPTESQTLLLTSYFKQYSYNGKFFHCRIFFDTDPVIKPTCFKVFVFALVLVVVFPFLYPVLIYLLECRFLLFFCSLMRVHQFIVDNVINVFLQCKHNVKVIKCTDLYSSYLMNFYY